MAWLEICKGPECPHCGCRDSEILKEPAGGRSWFNSGRARCRHCGMEFSFQELPPEPEPAPIVEPEQTVPIQIAERTIPAPKCPDCGGEMRVTSTRKAVRYHKCDACGRTMKTPKTA